jgi:hypothetical protein
MLELTPRETPPLDYSPRAIRQRDMKDPFAMPALRVLRSVTLPLAALPPEVPPVVEAPSPAAMT